MGRGGSHRLQNLRSELEARAAESGRELLEYTRTHKRNQRQNGRLMVSNLNTARSMPSSPNTARSSCSSPALNEDPGYDTSDTSGSTPYHSFRLSPERIKSELEARALESSRRLEDFTNSIKKANRQSTTQQAHSMMSRQTTARSMASQAYTAQSMPSIPNTARSMASNGDMGSPELALAVTQVSPTQDLSPVMLSPPRSVGQMELDAMRTAVSLAEGARDAAQERAREKEHQLDDQRAIIQNIESRLERLICQSDHLKPDYQPAIKGEAECWSTLLATLEQQLNDVQAFVTQQADAWGTVDKLQGELEFAEGNLRAAGLFRAQAYQRMQVLEQEQHKTEQLAIMAAEEPCEIMIRHLASLGRLVESAAGGRSAEAKPVLMEIQGEAQTSANQPGLQRMLHALHRVGQSILDVFVTFERSASACIKTTQDKLHDARDKLTVCEMEHSRLVDKDYVIKQVKPAINAKVAELEQTCRALNDSRTELESMEQELDQTQAQLDHVTAQLEEVTAETLHKTQTADKRIWELEEQVKQLKQDRATASANHARRVEELEAQLVAQGQAKDTKHGEEVAALHQQMEKAAAEALAESKERTESQARFDATAFELQQLESVKKEIERVSANRLQTAEDNTKQAEITIHKLSDDNNQLQQQVNGLIEDKQNLKKQVQELEGMLVAGDD